MSVLRNKQQLGAYHLANTEFCLARTNVGVSLRRNGEWLLRFASLEQPLFDEDEHATKDKVDLWHNLLALGVLTNRPVKEAGRDLNETEAKEWRGATNLYRTPLWPEAYKEWWKSVRLVRAEVHMVLNNLLRDGHVELELTDAKCEIDLQGHKLLRVPLASLFIGDRMPRASLQTAVLLRLAAVLEQHRLRRCVGCKILFFAHRSDQVYHARSCQMKAVMQRHRDKRSKKKSLHRAGMRIPRKSAIQPVKPKKRRTYRP